MSWGMADLRTVWHRCISIPHAAPWGGQSHHLLWADFALLVLARGEGRTGQGGRADGRRGAESSPREGAEEAGIHDGLSGLVRVSARLRGSNGPPGAGRGAIDALDQVFGAPAR